MEVCHTSKNRKTPSAAGRGRGSSPLYQQLAVGLYYLGNVGGGGLERSRVSLNMSKGKYRGNRVYGSNHAYGSNYTCPNSMSLWKQSCLREQLCLPTQHELVEAIVLRECLLIWSKLVGAASKYL